MRSDRDIKINIFWYFDDIDWKIKDANKSRWKTYMIKDRPGAIGFTSGFSQDSKFYGG